MNPSNIQHLSNVETHEDSRTVSQDNEDLIK